jgi:hypothetical protein
MFISPNKIIALLFVCISIGVQAQVATLKSSPLAVAENNDTVFRKKNFYLAAGEVLGLNMGVWAIDRLVLKTDYSKIGWQSIGDNFSHGFVWDNDKMSTNLFLHPYHGSIYYNAARTNGYGYFAATCFTLVGSLQWEFFMENEYPSINDVFATTSGGAILGEIAFRTSDILLDNRAKGVNRFFREFSAFLVSPARGLTRLYNGDMWRVRNSSGRQFGIPNVKLEWAAGVRNLEFNNEIFDEGFGLVASAALEYGERFETQRFKPYDYLTIRTNLNLQKGQPVLGQINVAARLWGTDWLDTKKDYLSFGFYQHFDYYDSDIISDVSGRVPYRFGAYIYLKN